MKLLILFLSLLLISNEIFVLTETSSFEKKETDDSLGYWEKMVAETDWEACRKRVDGPDGGAYKICYGK